MTDKSYISFSGFYVCDTIDDFFIRAKNIADEQERPSDLTIKTARKMVEYFVETPLSISICEKSILISYDTDNVIKQLEVTDANVDYLYGRLTSSANISKKNLK